MYSRYLGTLCCVASSFPSPLQQRSVFLLLFSCCSDGPPHGGVSPKGDYFPLCTFHLRVHALARPTFFTVPRSSHTRARFQRDFSPLFSIRDYSRWGLCLYFLAALSRQNRKTNEPMSEKKNHGTADLSLSHTHHTGRRWQSHNRVCKIFLPFCHTQNDCFRNSDQEKRPQNLCKSNRSMSTLVFCGSMYDFAAKWNAYR